MQYCPSLIHPLAYCIVCPVTVTWKYSIVPDACIYSTFSISDLRVARDHGIKSHSSRGKNLTCMAIIPAGLQFEHWQIWDTFERWFTKYSLWSSAEARLRKYWAGTMGMEVGAPGPEAPSLDESRPQEKRPTPDLPVATCQADCIGLHSTGGKEWWNTYTRWTHTLYKHTHAQTHTKSSVIPMWI